MLPLLIFLAGLQGPAPASATPQRPSLSFNASTVAARVLEVEAGATLLDQDAAVPVFVKYGLTNRLELEMGIDAVRSVDQDPGNESSIGDLILGSRFRSRTSGNGRAVAVAGFVKLPTAPDDTGSGEPDAGVTGILSMPAGRFSLDLNLGLTALGQRRGAVGQVLGVATLGIPGPGPWSFFAEAAWQDTATRGSGGFLDAGLAYAASPRAVFDLAAGIGWSDGFPDWTVAAGWTVLVRDGRRAGRAAY